MSRGIAGSILLLSGGLLVAGAGFLPWNHDRAHSAVLWESVDLILHPAPDEPLGWKDLFYHGGKIVGMGYPMAAGLLFALSAFFRRSRAGAALARGLHIFLLLAVAAAALGLSIVRIVEGGSWRGAAILLGTSLFLASLTALEARVGARWKRSRPGSPFDGANLVPALFILLLDGGLWLGLRKFENWPVQGYPVGFAGAGLVLLAIGRFPPRRAAPAPGQLTPRELGPSPSARSGSG
jgi:hypothetical protein